VTDLPAPAPVDYLEGLMEGFVAYDANWVMTYINASGERLLGRKREEVLGKTWQQAFPHAVGNPVDHMYQRVKRRRVAEGMEFRYAHYGTWMEISASPLSNGGIGVYFRDISDRKRVEEELRTLAAIVENSGDFVGLSSPDFVPLYVNEAGRRMLGLVDSDVTQTRVMDYFWPEDLPRIEAEAVPALERDGHWSGEVRFRHFQTGQPIPTMWNVFAIRDDSGKTVGYGTISPDLTAMKRADAALQAANAQLRDSARRKDEFLAVLAHELRNPLAPIANAVELLNLRGSQEPALQSAREVIARQVRHMVRLIDDLLDVGRITSGKLELRRERVELAVVVEQALETARPHLRGHEFTLSLPAQPVWLDADPVRLAQVLSNLLNNACKYTPGGGQIRLSAARVGAKVALKVRDNGIGIPREQLPALFNMFSQVAPPPGLAVGGLGIGLALSRTLVEMQEGTIEADSEGPGHGSEFTVTLPAFDEGATPRGPRTQASGTGADPRRILVVDDNQDSAASLARLLRADGHTTEVAYDGERAVQAAASFRPDTVLLDIGLPGMSGLDACRAIRSQAGNQHILIAAVTGLGQEEDERKSREAGFDAHLVKPVQHAALTALLAARKQ
jgi:PAS domain S-box-containing protein